MHIGGVCCTFIEIQQTANVRQMRLTQGKARVRIECACLYIDVIDPLGNLMMRFPSDSDLRYILKDLSRLLPHLQRK